MAKKSTARRSIVLRDLHGEALRELELSKVQQVDLTIDREFVYLEKRKDGTWSMSYTKKTIPEVSILSVMEMRRDNAE